MSNPNSKERTKRAKKSQTIERTRTKGRDAKPTAAFWRDNFNALSQEKGPKILPGVDAEIEADMSGEGNAFARRVGLSYLTKPFREVAQGMGEDRETAEMWLDLANRVDASAKAHREVARLLEMAHARMLTALSAVAAKVDRMPQGKAAA